MPAEFIDAKKYYEENGELIKVIPLSEAEEKVSEGMSSRDR